jgi:hypothetical protein
MAPVFSTRLFTARYARLTSATAAGVIGGALLLSGCSNPIDDAIDNAVEGAVENAVEEGVEKAIEAESGGDVDIEVGSSVSLPEDFPTDIPLPDGGTLIASLRVEQSWSLSYEVDSLAQADELVQEFGDWTQESVVDQGTNKFWILSNDNYVVTISAVQEGDEPAVLGMIVGEQSQE